LRHNDSLASQECGTLHAIAMMEAAVYEECLPLPPAQQWAGLPNTFWIATFCKEPPAISHAEAALVKGICELKLIDNQRPISSEQQPAVMQRVAHIRRCVQAICRDEDVALVGAKALEARIRVDVEQRILEEGNVREAHACLAQEEVGHVSEDVPFTRGLKDWQDARGGAT
jgi:hypothetical protein